MKCFYVVRASVPQSIEREWSAWMRDAHIPKLTALPWFNGAQFCKNESADNSFSMYIILYESVSREALAEYLQSDICRTLRMESNELYGNSVTLSREIWHEQE
ncbi:MAG TPA: DUF4286 family protein [Candidatus Kapabacteria bacterium]|nr:DUF4286 family protein [Candidatus Kapabacteria bacterium]